MVDELDRLRAKSPRPGFRQGESLTDHLTATLIGARRLQQRVGRIAAVPEGFWRWVLVAALTHDAGKVPEGFQAMVATPRGPIWGQRHEVYSLGFVADLLSRWPTDEQAWVGLGVLTHHRPLTGPAGRAILPSHRDPDPGVFGARFGHVDPTAQTRLRQWLAGVLAEEALAQDIPEVAGDIAEAGYRLLELLRARWGQPEDVVPADNLTAMLLQGAVTFADHVSSAHGQLLDTQPVDSVFADRLRSDMISIGKTLRGHQREVAKLDGHLLLRTPTGSGKTEAALLWAAQQVTGLRERGAGQPRVFYLLPYLASINAMVDRIGTMIGDPDVVGVVHSKAAAFHLHRSLCGSDDFVDAARQAVSRAAATRLFRELVRVGTPYQLLRGAMAGPACSSIVIDAANSVFILDELHSYEPQRLGMILAMIRFWVRLGGRIGVVTATMPQALVELLDECAVSDRFQQIHAEGGQWPQRHRLHIEDSHLTGPRSLALIETRLRAGQSVLVVANNVADARSIHTELAPISRHLYGEDSALLLHSRFKAKDRASIEQEIRQRFGSGHTHQPGLLVATQVVEVSLDVSFDALHTSGAPLEALVQRFGRVNRTADRPPADVVVHTPEYQRRAGSGDEYADGVYEREPTEFTMDLLESHTGTVLDEQLLGDWLNKLYASPWGEQWTEDVCYHQRSFDDLLRFEAPFDDARQQLTETFEELFDGVEAILTEDRDDYAAALNSATDPRAGRLLGSQFLIPLPHYGRSLGVYDRTLDVLIIDGDYSTAGGLAKIYRDTRSSYQPGQVI
ncbi:CRISPR-associated helicase/endonuclease Cas3 [Nocardia arizonensis]|uniref:CRISPR-associated helicase/endonuclease Cas3 n=1 Tax=Nocardia arizonensis TaxID=1141647 RepID=UPI0006D286EE|nr:CRISPR-associated helicase/endonuclease Cas3 [Nocardia arizonensis]